MPSGLVSAPHWPWAYMHIHYDIHTEGVPYDGVPEEDIRTAFIPLVIVIYLLAAAGILFAIVCLAFNYFFRNRKYRPII